MAQSEHEALITGILFITSALHKYLRNWKMMAIVSELTKIHNMVPADGTVVNNYVWNN